MSFALGHPPSFDHVDFELLALIVRLFLKVECKRWDHFDQLVAERAHLKTCQARNLYNAGKITGADLQLTYTEIDDELELYDTSPSVSSRHELMQMLRQLINRLHRAAQISRQQRKDKICRRILPTNLNPITT